MQEHHSIHCDIHWLKDFPNFVCCSFSSSFLLLNVFFFEHCWTLDRNFQGLSIINTRCHPWTVIVNAEYIYFTKKKLGYCCLVSSHASLCVCLKQTFSSLVVPLILINSCNSSKDYGTITKICYYVIHWLFYAIYKCVERHRS